MLFSGIDWADKEFVIVITDEQGKVVKNLIVKNNVKGFEDFIEKVRTVTSDLDEILFAIETPHSLFVDFLMETGYTVYAINPKSVDRYRDRYRTSGAKDDFFDATVLANILRTDRDRHQPIAVASDLARELKILTQDREKSVLRSTTKDEFVQTKTKLTNQLRVCLKSYYPEVCGLFGDFVSLSALTLLRFFPSWEDLNKMSEKELIQRLKKRKVTTPSILKKIVEHRQKPPIPVDSVLKRAKKRQMLTLVEQLIPLCERIKQYDHEIEQLLEKHSDKDIFLSLPGAGTNLSSRILSQLCDDRSRFQSVSEVRPLAGVAPVTKQSGNYIHVTFRFGCRKAFRNALQLFAFCSLSRCKWAYRYYQTHRKIGKTHHHALRLLSDKWLKIIFAMWKN